ncbi:unnamed protein product [Symbiodinium necroappetens]|uniref:Uncharacterized protein n=1 Tax=Symbiodinium necroappetens TaxID=1628268 RepID=A0A812LHZ4_9DINO|nr:unnamed protein product [Symbiodinium necroappetens]
MGVGFLARFGDICSSVVDGISEGINFGFNSYWVAWQGYYGENEAMDSCADYTDGAMYKAFCDLHCIEDEVLKGNAAVLRSMKTQETHVISTLHDMLKWYTTELFDKLKEAQDQSAQNTKEQERVQKAYFEQLATMQTDYAGQLNTQIDQLGVDINSRFDNNVVDPLNVLQGHLKTVNDNLISLGKWLADRPIFATDDAGWTPPTSVLDVSKSVPNASEAYAEAYAHVAAVHGEVLELSQALHGAMGREVSRDEQLLLPLLSRLASELAGLNATARTKEEPNLRSAAQTLRRYRQELSGLPSETLRETFQRRTKKSLQPALRRFRKQALLVSTLSSSLVQFGIGPKASQIGEPTSSFWASADKAEKYQDLMMLIHRDVSEYVQKARVFVSAHKDTLAQLLPVGDCGASVVEIGRQVAEMRLKEQDHVVSLLRTWRSVSQNLDFLANLVVDGEFLEAQLFQCAEVDQLTARSLRERLANETTPQLQSLLPVAQEAVSSNLLRMQPLMQHISQAFDLSQFLADMWVQGSFEVPKEELELVQGAWRRVIGAARQLLGDASYGNFGGSLSLALLRNALEKVVDADVFNPPAPCNDGKHLLWKLQPGGNAIVLNIRNQFMACNLTTGHLTTLESRFA